MIRTSGSMTTPFLFNVRCLRTGGEARCILDAAIREILFLLDCCYASTTAINDTHCECLFAKGIKTIAGIVPQLSSGKCDLCRAQNRSENHCQAVCNPTLVSILTSETIKIPRRYENELRQILGLAWQAVNTDQAFIQPQ